MQQTTVGDIYDWDMLFEQFESVRRYQFVRKIVTLVEESGSGQFLFAFHSPHVKIILLWFDGLLIQVLPRWLRVDGKTLKDDDLLLYLSSHRVA